VRLMGFSHYVATGFRGTLGLFEMDSSSCSASLYSCLLPPKLSRSVTIMPRITSDAVYSGSDMSSIVVTIIS